VVGLSLQETLGNLVSGLSIQVQRPFEVGDWIQMDPDPRNIGRVLEINWRATKVLTNEQIEVIIPNGALAKVSIRNFTQPSTTSRRTVEVQASYDTPPRKVEEALLDGVEAVPGVLTKPEPFVMLQKYADSGVAYQLCYFIEDFARRERIDSAVRERIWYAFRRRNIPIPFPVQSVQLHDVATKQKSVADSERAARLTSMRAVDFLATIPAPLLERFATLSHTYMYAPGEVIFRQGESGRELFIVESGEVAVIVGREGGSTAEVARLHRDACFGELAVMTGEPRSATVMATKDTVLVAIDRDTVHDLIADAPKVAEKLTEVLVARQTLLEESLSQRRVRDEASAERQSTDLLKKLRNFFAS
jgi:CRP-like cAMP-binding protein